MRKKKPNIDEVNYVKLTFCVTFVRDSYGRRLAIFLKLYDPMLSEPAVTDYGCSYHYRLL